MKKIPNILSFLRMFFSFIMIFFREYIYAFSVLYICCGISDVLDGYIARKLNAQTKKGAVLDSIADAIFYLVAISLLIIRKEFSPVLIICIAMVSAIRLSNFFVAHIRFKFYASIHTYLNKLSGLLVFIALLLMYVIDGFPNLITIIIAGVCFLSGLEEFFITLTSKKYDPNLASIFSSRK